MGDVPHAGAFFAFHIESKRIVGSKNQRRVHLLGFLLKHRCRFRMTLANYHRYILLYDAGFFKGYLRQRAT